MFILLAQTNTMIIEAGRGFGKTFVVAFILYQVVQSLPKSNILIIGPNKSQVANKILSSYIKELDKFLIRNIDYKKVTTLNEIDDDFEKPHYIPTGSGEKILFRNGALIEIAGTRCLGNENGGNYAYHICEEGKFYNSENFKEIRLTLRYPEYPEYKYSPFYLGKLIVCDTPAEKENNWFLPYEKECDQQKIQDVVTLAVEVNDLQKIYWKLDTNQRANLKIKEFVLAKMRRESLMYIRCSSIPNLQNLTTKFFKNAINDDESANFRNVKRQIFAIKENAAEMPFFVNFDLIRNIYPNEKSLGTYKDADNRLFTAQDLNYYDPNLPLYLGYDPGPFASVVVAQIFEKEKIFRIFKNFYVNDPENFENLSFQITSYFKNHIKKEIELFYDVVANNPYNYFRAKKNRNKNAEKDINLFVNALEKNFEGNWRINLKNLDNKKFMMLDQYFLVTKVFSEENIYLIQLNRDECGALISSVQSSERIEVRVKGATKIFMNKNSEKKYRGDKESLAHKSPQLASAMVYLLKFFNERFQPNNHKEEITLLTI